MVFWGLLAAVAAFCLDQFSKFWIDTQVVTTAPIAVCEHFNLVKVWNTGVSFSMFNSYGKLGTVMLCLVALVVSGALVYWMFHEQSKGKIICLGLIVGGALGNVADRFRFGAVMDFLDFYIGSYHWPAFNLADSFICVGALCLVYAELIYKKKGLYR